MHFAGKENRVSAMAKPNLVPAPVRDAEPAVAPSFAYALERDSIGFYVTRYTLSGSSVTKVEHLHGPDILGICMGKLEDQLLASEYARASSPAPKGAA